MNKRHMFPYVFSRFSYKMSDTLYLFVSEFISRDRIVTCVSIDYIAFPFSQTWVRVPVPLNQKQLARLSRIAACICSTTAACVRSSAYGSSFLARFFLFFIWRGGRKMRQCALFARHSRDFSDQCVGEKRERQQESKLIFSPLLHEIHALCPSVIFFQVQP